MVLLLSIDKLLVNPIPLLFQESLFIKDFTNLYVCALNFILTFKKYKCQKGENGFYEILFKRIIT